MNRAAPYIAIAALLAVVFLMKRVSDLEDMVRASRQGNLPANGAPIQATGTSKIEVAQYMGRIQNYTHKMWFAAQGGDLALTDFYRHEMKEEMEAIASSGLVDSGVPVADNMKLYGISAADTLKAQIKAHGLADFSDHFGVLINTCNSCHVACGHPELKMNAPNANRFSDQTFH